MTNFFPSNFVGFENLLPALNFKLGGYPPYNVVKTGDNTYQIELACAGFSKTDIDVSVEGNTLSVSGETKPDPSVEMIHNGIANRAFLRKFTIADSCKVTNAEMINGILKIVLDAQVAASTVNRIAVK